VGEEIGEIGEIGGALLATPRELQATPLQAESVLKCFSF
jgi:hypothetical protein